MAFLRITSPHLHGPNRTGNLMKTVALATLPGLGALTWFFGWGSLINVVWACTVAVVCEAIILLLRRRPVLFYLRDYSAPVTGVLLGLALPPYAPWWITLVGVGTAIIIAKHLYGGMGFNPFNPAMVGYALLLVSFPVYMTTRWAAPAALLENGSPGFFDTLRYIFTGEIAGGIDAYTMATPLDVYKHEVGAAIATEIQANPIFGDFVALGWEWVSLAYLAGGLFLLYRKIITWHTPVGVLGALAACALVFGWDPDSSTPLTLHLLGGATMLGAFFIATDPVTSATSNTGRLVFGAGIGVLTYVIRSYGGYPDAIAFSVLLMNFAAPFIDYYTQPRAYGHTKPKRGIGGGSK